MLRVGALISSMERANDGLAFRVGQSSNLPLIQRQIIQRWLPVEVAVDVIKTVESISDE
jgi:hypothetical protein